ncbi:hypothetical protein A3I45_03400 [Candidatus Uhrbacteria bacterium RIFCSPLOWO2_02_FULL_53_10]|uniref:L,D-TPase catalytic domain-containing protein n=1 Tax=Candidatus Uhrbacteria bacterium RIFCSPLOWO2_02_FULL_53_10 TaxID=1802411 RepID=A0A1F7VG36_9BACT|nr:MAG: hypothetical protein A3I45_03400 [Candidatus Uhrbacteria bacterium RIFCSPLOWO2_02_FULL_53_10]
MHRRWSWLIAILIVSIPNALHAAQASVLVDGTVVQRTWDVPFETIGNFVSIDLGMDGTEELVVGNGAGHAPSIAILREDGSRLNTFVPFAHNEMHGTNLVVGDVDGDGALEIVVANAYGSDPLVRVLSTFGELEQEFYAYAETFRGGVNLAVGDIDGDGVDDIVTAAGLSGGPHVRVFRNDGRLITDAFVFDTSDRSGVGVATLDVNHDGRRELMVTHFGKSTPEARLVSFTENGVALHEPFPTYAPRYVYGTSVFPVDDVHVAIAPNGHGGPHIRMFSAQGEVVKDWFAYEADVRDRVLISASSLNHIVTARATPVLVSRLDRHIRVDLSEQHLYAYQDGVRLIDFPISAARRPWKTPTGEFSIMRKLPIHTYRWFDRAGNLLYNLPNVEYNLEFTPHIYIHYAYWHNNFGRPMSHGCVNAPYDGIKWLYEWANVGTPVVVTQ